MAAACHHDSRDGGNRAGWVRGLPPALFLGGSGEGKEWGGRVVKVTSTGLASPAPWRWWGTAMTVGKQQVSLLPSMPTPHIILDGQFASPYIILHITEANSQYFRTSKFTTGLIMQKTIFLTLFIDSLNQCISGPRHSTVIIPPISFCRILVRILHSTY